MAEIAAHICVKNQKIKHCIGCFTCWTKTPGNCIHKDDMTKELFPKWLKSDLVVYATPLYHYTVNAEMKAFIDRGFSNMHVQMLKGKYTLPIITSGSWILEDALDYLEKTLQKNGCWVVDRVGISMAEWSQLEEEKKAQLLGGVDRLVASIAEQRIFEDQIEPLQEIFELWRSVISYFKDENLHEFQTWTSRWPDAPPD